MEGEAGKVLQGSMPPRLSFFRRVDPLQADLVLPIVPIEKGKRIAVRDTDHRPGDCFGPDGKREHQ
jgi:hypothetical protein